MLIDLLGLENEVHGLRVSLGAVRVLHREEGPVATTELREGHVLGETCGEDDGIAGMRGLLDSAKAAQISWL